MRKKNKKKIVHIITSLRQGGAQRVLCELIASTKNDFDHKVYVLLNERNSDMTKIIRSNGVDIHYFDTNNPISILKSLIFFNNFLSDYNPHLIQTWLYHSDLFSCFFNFKKIPIIWNIRHTNSSFKAAPIHRLLTIKICSILSYFVPKIIISCSKSGIEYHEKIGYSKRFKYIPNGNTRRLDLLNTFEKRKDIDKYTIGFFHRFNQQKDIETFFKACKILKENYSRKIILLIAGANMDTQNLELANIIKKYHLENETKLYGFTNEIELYILKSDLTVLSSKEGEGCPNIIIESMSYRVPVVSTNCGDSKLIIGNSGYIVPIKNPDLLAKKINLLFSDIEDKEKYENLKRLCEERWNKYYQKKDMIQKYEYFWNKYAYKNN
tara:strand:- start:4761 stop:5900 length:1140 start_codon:yes stop_codon:yes gene_type:complete